jgi:acyl carrier protein
MQDLVTEERVIQEVTRSIAETLRAEVSAITPGSSLIRDLGAQSLDFLDVNYRLEQIFGIRTARHFVLEHVEEMFGEGSAIDENGQLTERAIALLNIRLGDHHDDLKPGMDMEEVSSLITVQTLAKGVMDILQTLPAACPGCGRSAWKTEDGTHIRCGSCGAAAVYTTGDDLIKAWLGKVQEDRKIF